jgi:uncharacterized protein YeaO (DUF488 family)
MPIRIVRLGSPRAKNEGLRIGTVRRPPRGVPKAEFSKRNYYDVWLPELSPQPESVASAIHGEQTPAAWKKFVARYVKEMSQPGPRHMIAVLAAMSHQTNLSVGCYCEDESRCHRSVLRDLLISERAEVVD